MASAKHRSSPSQVLLLVILGILIVGLLAYRRREESDWWTGRRTLNVDGLRRKYILDVPSDLRPNSPLVMVFHGYTGSATEVRQQVGLTRLAQEHGFVVAYPDGTQDAKDSRFFQVGYAFHHDQEVDDVRFVRQLAAHLVQEFHLDERAVFATGFSNGGDFCYLLASQPKPFVRAVAPVAGTMMAAWGKELLPQARISVLAVNAKDDAITRWDGDLEHRDIWGPYFGVEAVVDFWVQGLALEQASTQQLTQNIRLRAWTTAVDDAEVSQYEFSKGGHSWPGHLGNEDVSTAQEIWRFFEKHLPKPP
ncbi:MAG: prolyl oligopeptidase family serine peptidase [Planctomycetota bacterium]|nr:prolyl oligopeptidase family serine peptidase [Planctomycetota bacterium]